MDYNDALHNVVKKWIEFYDVTLDDLLER